jgi:hypothetical protein
MVLPKIYKNVLLFAILLLCMLSVVIYTTVYIQKNRNYIERNHIILIENQKLLIENQKLLFDKIKKQSLILNDMDSIDSIYKKISINDSIIYKHMKNIEINLKAEY